MGCGRNDERAVILLEANRHEALMWRVKGIEHGHEAGRVPVEARLAEVVRLELRLGLLAVVRARDRVALPAGRGGVLAVALPLFPALHFDPVSLGEVRGTRRRIFTAAAEAWREHLDALCHGCLLAVPHPGALPCLHLLDVRHLECVTEHLRVGKTFWRRATLLSRLDWEARHQTAGTAVLLTTR